MSKKAGLLAIFALLAAPVAFCQFEGVLKVQAFTDAGGQTRKGNAMTLYFAKDAFRWEQQMMGISAGSQIFKRQGNLSVMLNEEKKRFCRMTGQEWVADKKTYTGYNPFRRATAEVAGTGRTRKIAGYDCAEWKIAYKSRPSNEPVTYLVWTTDKLGLQGSPGFGPEMFEMDMVGIVWVVLYDKGLLPMGWSTTEEDGDTKRVEVVSVEKKKVDAALFEVPAGYAEVKEVADLYK